MTYYQVTGYGLIARETVAIEGAEGARGRGGAETALADATAAAAELRSDALPGGAQRWPGRPGGGAVPDQLGPVGPAPAPDVTLRGRGRWRVDVPYPPFCADFGAMPITMLAVQIRAFCASTSRAGGDRWLHPGADGRRSGQRR
jgi:hypothetical protein